MSFTARLVHTVTHVHIPYDSTAVDDYNQPTGGTVVETTVRANVQPKPATQQLADSRSAGSALADHVIFLNLMTLAEADHFLWHDDRFEIVGIRRFEFGRSPHLEVDARRVTSAELEAAGS